MKQGARVGCSAVELPKVKIVRNALLPANTAVLSDGKDRETEITQVCALYGELARSLGAKTRSPLSPKLRDQADRYLRWCRKYGVDPRLYLQDRAAHARRAGTRLPLLGRMPSWAALEQHRSFGLARAVTVAADQALGEVDTSRPTGRLSPHRERFKRFYQGGSEELCRQFRQHSGGFTQSSQVCRGCRLAVSCKSGSLAP